MVSELELENIEFIDLARNNISDIEPLVRMNGLGEGDRIILFDNPVGNDRRLREIAQPFIDELRARGVTVEIEESRDLTEMMEVIGKSILAN